jgi:acetylornithine deacetylase/succinyl-diaminopimelate desuccinylase-like protein
MTSSLEQFVNQQWDQEIIPQLIEYIKIPAKSPSFDTEWQKNGFIDQAVNQIATWCRAQPIAGLEVEIVRLEGRTPLIYMEIPGNNDRTILMYGHCDKQPEMSGWDDDLGPWKPVLREDKLYGRGGADDGYAAFASLTAIRALQEQKLPHSRIVIVIEACEESGSYDLPPYIEALKSRIGTPDLVICLDSMSGNYEQLWLTTSLRGLVNGELHVSVLRQGVHSGQASGIVPSSFRVMRELLSRVEDQETGDILLEQAHVDIPQQRREQTELAAKVLGERIAKNYPWQPGAHPDSTDYAGLLLRRNWQPALSITGADGIPSLANAGNVSRPKTAVMLSLRTPPTCDAKSCTDALKAVLEKDPPYGAKVEFVAHQESGGWNAPATAQWLVDACESASQTFFDKPALYSGEGGTIPFMGMLGAQFPHAQFMITGVLGPKSNAHGPNEFLHIPMGKKLTACVAFVVAEHFKLK